MGLMLSILITCVGVAELWAFCANVRRRLVMPLHPTLPPPQPRLQQHAHDQSCATAHYLKELNRERNRLLNEIRRREGGQRRSSVSPDTHKSLNATQTHGISLQASATQNAGETPQNATDISHKSYGLEIGEDYHLEDASLGSFPEKHVHHVFPSYSDGGNKPVINLNRPKEEAPQIVLNDSAYESSQASDNYEQQEHREREGSPFPTYERMAPRGSICSELIVNPTVSVDEVDEEAYRSQGFSNQTDQKQEEYLKSQFDSKDYWKHKSKSRSRTPDILRENLLDFERKTRSRSPSPMVRQEQQNRKEESTQQKNNELNQQATSSAPADLYQSTRTDSIDLEPAGATITELPTVGNVVGVEKDVLETLDGKLTPHEQHKRMFKNKKQRKNKRSTNDKELELEQQRLERQSDYGSYSSSSSVIGVDEHALDGRHLRDVELEEVQEAGPSSSKQGEPFWLIFSGEYTKAMNKDWHGQHFCCWQCDESLTGQRYVLRDEHPYCVSCYESVFANGCEKCNKIIGIDSKDLSYKDKHWHEACFLCTACGESLVDKQFGSRSDRIYCGRCYDEKFASRCDGCGEIFRAGTKKMEYKTRQWHEKCFCCVMCKTPIGTQSFIPREQEIYCAKCYEEKYATRCIKCNKVITSGGVTYKNEPWHRDCFTCTNCSNSLAGERFTSRDDKPYCANCFGELFAKRCFACRKPITGIGGTKFISFEDRHWHNDCFFCASCRTSLVGRGFITDQEDIICPECAKQKLM